MKIAILAAAALALAGVSAAHAAPTAQQEKMKACGAKWTEMKAKGQTGKETYAEYSKKCMGSAAAEPAKPASQQDKMKACAAEWNAKKAKKATGKETYAEFSKTCLAKG